jgi:hypothetical protein
VQLVEALRHGGYVLVMRHPSSPQPPPDRASANPDNPRLERQLDATGRDTARAMGAAFNRLHIPLGEVLSSPTYRALVAIRLAGFGPTRIVPQLDEGLQGMQGTADETRALWLRKQASQPPKSGTNTLVVTQTPNLLGAFGRSTGPIAAGEALIFHPDGKGGTTLVGRIQIEEWARL